MNKAVLNWIYTNSKKSIPFILLLTALSVALSIISLAFSLVSKDVIDIATKQMEGNLVKVCIVLAVLLALQLFIQVSVTFINVIVNSKMEMGIKRSLFKRLLKKEYLAVSRFHSAELLNRLNSDVSVIVNAMLTIIPSTALLLTQVVGGFIILLTLDKLFAVLVLLAGPVVLVCARLYSRRFKELHKQMQLADGRARSFMQEIFQNILVIKSFRSEQKVTEQSDVLQKKTYSIRIKRTLISIFANIGLFLVFNAGYYFALGYGAFRLSHGVLSFGTVTAMLSLVGQIQTPFRDLSNIIPTFYAMTASIERLIELKEIKEEPLIPALPEYFYMNMQEIVFDNMSFAYNKDAVVHDISMVIGKGQFAVIAGESGAGKSTVMKLLLGILQPDQGRIYINSAGGQTTDIGICTRSLFSYVPQGNLILSGSIRDNIVFGKADASDEDIVRCAQIAQIWEMISSLKEGLDTQLGEKGIGLSEGQVQRIAIARAILYDAPILLLDEATSALDAQTEEALLKALKQMTDKTCIIISHRPAAFELCDCVIQIKK